MGKIRSFLKNFRSGGWDGNGGDAFTRGLNLNGVYGAGLNSNRENIENDFEAYVAKAFKSNGPVFSCITARQFVFAEAVFKYKNKITGKLHGNTNLSILENPWPGGTTGELLARMEQDVSLAGNSYWTLAADDGSLGNAAKGKEGLRLSRLRPDWVTLIIGRKGENLPLDVRAIDATLLGIQYQPTSTGHVPSERVLLSMDEVVHYSPIPDPVARFRGMSWITPIVREVQADIGFTKHKGAFIDNSAVPNMAVAFDKDTSKDDFEEFVAAFREAHQGAQNAYKTLFLMGGADVTPLSHDFKQMDFTGVVGKGESRIASAAGVPPSWVGFSEGMQGSALNTGNMAANRRRFADGTIRPLWRIVAASLAVLLDVPEDSVLWWDETDIAFLREDQRDRADIMRIDMNSVDSAIKSGFDPDAAVAAVQSNDIASLLGKHTGLVSVQMQPPVDPKNELEETKGQADIFETQAKTVQELISAGFTADSVVVAVASNDLTKLVKAPVVYGWSPTGQPLRQPPTAEPGQTAPPLPGAPPTGTPGAAPAAPGGKPPAAPGKPPVAPAKPGAAPAAAAPAKPPAAKPPAKPKEGA